MADSKVEQLLTAVTAGDESRVRELLEAHPELQQARNEAGISPILLAIYHGHPNIAALFHRALDVFEASALGNIDRVRELADQVNSTSPDGFHPLGLACFFGQTEVALFLLEAGANVHTASSNKMRVQPIHAAAARRAAGLIQALIDKGADPNAKQHLGYTPLHSAAQNGDSASIDVLLSAGADRSLRSDEGKTAADYARQAGHEDIARRLE